LLKKHHKFYLCKIRVKLLEVYPKYVITIPPEILEKDNIKAKKEGILCPLKKITARFGQKSYSKKFSD